jgi:hypothetical protein
MNEASTEPADLALPVAICRLLSHDLPRAADPGAALAIVEAVRQQLLGDGLLTINLDVTSPEAAPGVVELQRAWSSRPAHYPVAGRKRKTLTPWTRQLLRQAEVFVGEGDDALAAVFDDAALIRSMGLHAVVNVPLVEPGGRCFATFNVLGGNQAWTPRERLLIELLAVLALPAVGRIAERLRPAAAMAPAG